MHPYPFFIAPLGKLARCIKTKYGKAVVCNSEDHPVRDYDNRSDYTCADIKPPVVLNVFTGDYKRILNKTPDYKRFDTPLRSIVFEPIDCLDCRRYGLS
jgi:hypothetical protein